MTRRLHYTLVFLLIAIFLIGLGVGVTQKNQLTGNLFNRIVVSEQPLVPSETLEVLDVTVDPARIYPALYDKATLRYTITREAQVTSWIEDDQGRVVQLLRPATILSPGVFNESWDGRVVNQGALLGQSVEAGTYSFVLMAVDLGTDEIVQSGASLEIAIEELSEE